MSNEIWLAPLLLLPGVALLIMSTQARFGQLHNEVHHWLSHREESHTRVACLRFRAQLFSKALMSLYISVAAFGLGSMIGALFSVLGAESIAAKLVVFMTCLGILTLIIAAITLIRESRHSLKIIDDHLGSQK